MIKVHKSPNIPSSLTTTAAYDGEDVKRQLLADQHDKCYICERNRDTDFEIEHHKSQTNYPDLVQNWDNLFMGCRYCNGKKSSDFDNTLNPKDCCIEDEIEQGIMGTVLVIIQLKKVIDEENRNTKYRRSGECL